MFVSWQLEVVVKDGPPFLAEEFMFVEGIMGGFAPDDEPSEEVPDEEELNPTMIDNYFHDK